MNIYGIKKLPDGKKFWDKIGNAKVNRDGSINLYFDYFPAKPDIDIQIREKREFQEKK